MLVEYQAQGGRPTHRHRVDLTPREMEALADLWAKGQPLRYIKGHASLFNDGRRDPIATGLGRIALEWKLDGQAQGELLSGKREAA